MYINKIINQNIYNSKNNKLANSNLNTKIKNTNPIQNSKIELSGHALAFAFQSKLSFQGQHRASEKDVINLYKDLNSTIVPDKYQIEAVRAILDGNSVIVTAPTGTGKTLIAEGAIANNLGKRNRTFYTTPLKALTNQKYIDFKKEFGEKNVGIVTGDISENPDASIVLMTTEVYRNMLKNPDMHDFKKTLGTLKTVILDEFHYMNDIDRGLVWEESIMNSPQNIQLISLSATVKNADKISNWMQSLTPDKKVSLLNVPSSERYVPLRFYRYDAFSKNKPLILFPENRVNIKNLLSQKHLSQRVIDVISELGMQSKSKKFPLDEGFETLNYIFKTSNKVEMGVNELAEKIASTSRIDLNNALKIALVLSNNMPEENKPNSKKLSEKIFYADKDKRNEINTHDINNILSLINPRSPFSMLDGVPAIVFLFSRKGCEFAADKYLQHLLQPRMKSVLKNKERTEKNKEIEKIINEKINEGKILGFGFNKKARKRLMAGIGVHHAGMLPAHKALIEELFQKKLLDVVFATETLSAGINMPAKTTIITSLTKPSKNSTIKELSVNEFQQMAGRAGRRGIDDIGYVITMPEGPNEIEKCKLLASSVPDSIKSKFNILPADVISILQENKGIFDENKIKQFVSKSFAVYSSENPNELIDKYINDFKMLLNILKKTNFIYEIEANKFKITDKANMLAEIKGINEIFLADLIDNGVLARLSPLELAITLSTLTVENRHMDNLKYLKQDIATLEEELSYPLFNILPYVTSTNKLLEKFETDKLNKVSMAPYQATYTYEFMISDEEDYETRWKNILKMMDDDGKLYFEGNFFYSLNMTIDLLKQIDAACSIMLKTEKDTYKRQMFEALSDNAKNAMEMLNIPPLNESL